jgi:hypothetical protein
LFTKKRTFRLAAILLLLLGVFIGLRWLLSSQRLRRNWKNQAVIEVARLAADGSWISAQTALVQKQVANGPHEDGTWIGSQIVVMGNGEWVVFKNECVHHHQLLGDIFIGKASDGRWYYSSFHFCCDMVVPRMEAQPADLQTFIKDYFLREFDGKSDEAINQTWVPGSSPIG